VDEFPEPGEKLIIENRRLAKYGEQEEKEVHVPQLAMLDCAEFDIISKAEVHFLRLNGNGEGLWRLTCEYDAVLGQDLDFGQYPYDKQILKLRFGISVYKKLGQTYSDMAIAAAEVDDNEKDDGHPFGKIEGKINVPGFHLGHELHKNVLQKSYGAFNQRIEFCIPIRRYHTTINKEVMTPLLYLHFLAILSRVLPIEEVASRVSTLLSIAFVEIGVKFILDRKLPTVNYPILIQRMVNASFYSLLLLGIESYLLYFFIIRVFDEGDVDENQAFPLPSYIYYIDGFFALLAFLPIVWIWTKMQEGEKSLSEWQELNQNTKSS